MMTRRSCLVRVRLTSAGWGWLAVALALTATGLTKNITLILLIAYFLGGLLVLNWGLVRRSLRGVRAEHGPPSPCFAGERTRWSVVISHGGKRPLIGVSVRG